MVDFGEAATQSFEYSFFRGLNTRDDENHLPYGQTPFAKNFELTRQTGLKKKKGFQNPFITFDESYAFAGASNYRDLNNIPYYLSVSYPNVFLHNKHNGFSYPISNNLTATGKPFFINAVIGKTMIVDGANPPLMIDNGVATSAVWPPNYVEDNKDVLDESINAEAANPTTLGSDIGFPSFGTFYANRIWLAGDKLAPQRIYVSKLFNLVEFGDNSITNFDTAFFVDVQTTSPITSLSVISNKFLVIYCEREIHVLSGLFPPGQNWPQPHFRIDELNSTVGAIGPRLVARKGNNDHFYVANDGVVYTLSNTDNFEDVRPRGLSSRVFSLLEGLNNNTLKRGYLTNLRNKGELQLWYPSKNNLYYPDKRLIFNYSDSNPEEEEWSLDDGFGDLTLRSAFVDDETRELILLSRDKFLINDRGLCYDGEDIVLEYQLSALDFGLPDNNKEIVSVSLMASNESQSFTTLTLFHLWENGQSGFTKFDIPPQNESLYGIGEYGTATFASKAGRALVRVEKQIANPLGKKVKFRIRHSEKADLFLHSLIFRYRILGK